MAQAVEGGDVGQGEVAEAIFQFPFDLDVEGDEARVDLAGPHGKFEGGGFGAASVGCDHCIVARGDGADDGELFWGGAEGRGHGGSFWLEEADAKRQPGGLSVVAKPKWLARISWGLRLTRSVNLNGLSDWRGGVVLARR